MSNKEYGSIHVTSWWLESLFLYKHIGLQTYFFHSPFPFTSEKTCFILISLVITPTAWKNILAYCFAVILCENLLNWEEKDGSMWIYLRSGGKFENGKEKFGEVQASVKMCILNCLREKPISRLRNRLARVSEESIRKIICIRNNSQLKMLYFHVYGLWL